MLQMGKEHSGTTQAKAETKHSQIDYREDMGKRTKDTNNAGSPSELSWDTKGKQSEHQNYLKSFFYCIQPHLPIPPFSDLRLPRG
jgi:hypothetical protein